MEGLDVSHVGIIVRDGNTVFSGMPVRPKRQEGD
jgi:hypothetical protein